MGATLKNVPVLTKLFKKLKRSQKLILTKNGSYRIIPRGAPLDLFVKFFYICMGLPLKIAQSLQNSPKS